MKKSFLLIIFILLFSTIANAGIKREGQNNHENYHARYNQDFRDSHNIQAAISKKLDTRIDQEWIKVHLDPATLHPNLISVQKTGVKLDLPAIDSPEEDSILVIKKLKDLWELTETDIENSAVKSVSRKGLNVTRLIQRINGIDVFCSEISIAFNKERQVVSIAGQFFSGTDSFSGLNPDESDIFTEKAIVKSIFDLTNISLNEFDFHYVKTDGQYRFYEFEPLSKEKSLQFQRLIRVKDVIFPLGGDVFIPGYYIELWVDKFHASSYIIEADETPQLLFRKDLTASEAFKYRVHNTGDEMFRPEDGPAPGSPHPTGLPDDFQAPTILEKLVEVESLLSGDPWLPPDAETTSGNNCVAYANLKRPDRFNSRGDVMGEISEPGVFDYVYDHSQNSDDPQNLQNSVVGMFFHVNWLHDRWYEAGFDEASGNGQDDNYGRGGLGEDPVVALGNDYRGVNNAFMATGADGGSPAMHMFEFVGTSSAFIDLPSRTSNHEALITFHEMGHYITNRLVGDASGLFNTQGAAMGEGWGDFFAICMTSQSSDDFERGVFAVGGWTDYLLVDGFTQNYYFSVRRYPYSADMSKNPLTFHHISRGVDLPRNFEIPRNPLLSRASFFNNEIHSAGEIWCATLWEVFINLVNKYEHVEAERRMLAYVIGGLKITPSGPTYIEARDAILSAVIALNPEDLPEIWKGFAKRGMGVDAVAPRSTSRNLKGVVESFDIPDDLLDN